MSASRRRFSREFKLEAVRQVVDADRPLMQVARELDISASVLRRWKQRFEEDPSEAFPGNGRTLPIRRTPTHAEHTTDQCYGMRTHRLDTP